MGRPRIAKSSFRCNCRARIVSRGGDAEETPCTITRRRALMTGSAGALAGLLPSARCFLRQRRRRPSPVRALTQAYNASGQQLFKRTVAAARQHRVLALFDRHRDGDGARRRARRDRAADGRGAAAPADAAARSTRPTRRCWRRSTATTERGRRRPVRRACSLTDKRCEEPWTASGGCHVSGAPRGRHVRRGADLCRRRRSFRSPMR